MYGLVLAVTSSGVALGAVVLNRIAITVVEAALLLVGALLWRRRRARLRERARDAVRWSSASSARRRRARRTSPRRSPTACPESSCPPTRCRRSAGCRSSRTSRSAPTRLLGIWAADARGVGRRVSGARSRGGRRARRRRLDAGGRGRAPASTCARRWPGSSCRRPRSRGTRERLEALYDELGAEAAHAELAARDPAAASRVHPNDRRRVVRALELTEAGESLAPTSDSLWGDGYRHPTIVVGLDVPRDVLTARIEARTRSMVERGRRRGSAKRARGPISRTALTIHGLRDFAELPLERGGRDVQPPGAALRRVPAEVDAPDPRRRHHRREPTRDRGGR